MAVQLANPPGTDPAKMTFRLSPSQLSTFVDDPRLFWMHHRYGTRLPDGIKSSIPDDIDEAMKYRFDVHRRAGTLPVELEPLAKRGIKLCPDVSLLARVRNYRSAPMWTDPETGCMMSGALDDIVVFADGRMAPLDIKTTKKRDNFLSYAKQWALIQQSWYGILLEQIATVGVHTHAFLPYYYPIPAADDARAMDWGFELVEMEIDRKAAIATFRAAIKCLRGPLPPARVKRHGGDKIRDYNGWAHEFVAGVTAETKVAAKTRVTEPAEEDPDGTLGQDRIKDSAATEAAGTLGQDSRLGF